MLMATRHTSAPIATDTIRLVNTPSRRCRQVQNTARHLLTLLGTSNSDITARGHLDRPATRTHHRSPRTSH